ncbi:RDD family protein [Pelagicoccus sp. SDUM812003]|uniref:RDD family protein n=1 Tax=Pelagicoccus sp. SDUM812003 TaxID=3041267 RepID=UPI00280D9523|nr:RDD family protein [Pelagicoccus sp. SDUM812003]MDQ8202807.1 RDD family protein [Pelagicoccus sp. SDUM812003]
MHDVQLFSILINLGVSLLLAALIYSHYKERDIQENERYSTFWPRFLSPAIDAVVLWPITSLLPFIAFALTPSSHIAINIATTLFFYAYSIYFHGSRGGTIGKLACKIRVVDHQTEQPITFVQAFKRDAIPFLVSISLYAYAFKGAESGSVEQSASFAIVPSIAGIWFIAEVITMLTNEKRRALHDFIAGTVVVRQTKSTDASPENAEPQPVS